MTGLVSRVVLLGALAAAQPAGATDDAHLSALLRPAQYDEVSLSPDGSHLALSYRLADRSVLTIVDRATMKITGGMDPGKDAFIEGVQWANGRRLFVTTSQRFDAVQQPWLMATTIAVDVDGRNRSTFVADVIDMLPRDDEHLLVRRCAKRVRTGCMTEVRRVPIDFRGNGERIALGPEPNSLFQADADSRVRFAWGWDDKDQQWLSMLEGEGKDSRWQPVNVEAESGVEVIPIGVSADGRYGFLLTEHRTGPDSVEKLEFATGNRTEIYRHDTADPERVIWSADGTEPIGVVLSTPVPQSAYWNESHPDAVFRREIDKAFPGESASISDFASNGELALVTVSGDREPGRFYLIQRSNGNVTLLNKRRPWLQQDRLAVTRPIAMKARDGLALDGFLTLPLRTSTSPAPPLVVLPHGGPYEVRDTWHFDEEVQLLALHGYAVLRVNFRGSGGRGRAFVEAGFREWGGRMQDDLTDATRWAIAGGIADPARICIFGTSFGGYAALMGAIREPELYRCAVAVAAPTDLDLVWQWGDIQRSRSGKDYLERAIGRDPADLARRSPARRAGELKARLMLVHGRRDYRVSYEHAKAMQKALANAGVEYVGLFPRDETHGIYGDENRADYYRRLLDFLDESIGRRSAAAETDRPTAQTQP